MRRLRRSVFWCALLVLPASASAQAEDFTYCRRGTVAREAGDLDLAVAHYDRCLAEGDLSTESRADFLFNRGLARQENGDLEGALADYTESIRLDGGSDAAMAYNNRGNVLSDLGEIERAIGDYGEAMRLAPDAALPYFNRGNAYSNTGRAALAIKDYAKAARLDPSHYKSLNGLAWLLATASDARLRDGERAVFEAKRALQLHPDDHLILDTLAAAYAETGRFAEAIATQRQAIAVLEAQGGADLANYQKRLAGYQQGIPWHE
jgi:tetratricopeptide (TPR) repeat protein